MKRAMQDGPRATLHTSPWDQFCQPPCTRPPERVLERGVCHALQVGRNVALLRLQQMRGKDGVQWQ